MPQKNTNGKKRGILETKGFMMPKSFKKNPHFKRTLKVKYHPNWVHTESQALISIEAYSDPQCSWQWSTSSHSVDTQTVQLFKAWTVSRFPKGARKRWSSDRASMPVLNQRWVSSFDRNIYCKMHVWLDFTSMLVTVGKCYTWGTMTSFLADKSPREPYL